MRRGVPAAPRNLFIRMKLALRGKIEYKANWFSVKGMGPEELVAKVKCINLKKYNV